MTEEQEIVAQENYRKGARIALVSFAVLTTLFAIGTFESIATKDAAVAAILSMLATASFSMTCSAWKDAE